MRGITFGAAAPERRVSPARMDIAFLMGFLSPREPLPAEPVVVESPADLARHFRPGRPLVAGGPQVLPATLAAAVEAFLAHGGRRCLVLGMGEPPPLRAGRGARLQALLHLLGGAAVPPVPDDLGPEAIARLPLPDLPHPRTARERVQGLGHLYQEEEACLLLLPDLAELVAPPPDAPAADPAAGPRPPERFVDCARTLPEPLESLGARLAPPLVDEAGLVVWRRVVGRLLARLDAAAPDRMLLAGLPPPDAALAARLAREGIGLWLEGIEAEHLRLLQLVQPWLRAPESGLPGGLLPPEAALAGLLAAHALERGAFLSAGGRPLPEGTRLAAALADPEGRASLLETGPRGPRLVVDHTASPDPAWRPAAVRRLAALLMREARGLGTALVFEPAGERLWDEVRARMAALLMRAFEAGALRGRSAAEAFSVRCDRDTMSRADIDQGRVIAEVGFLPAVPVEEIRIRLPLEGAVR